MTKPAELKRSAAALWSLVFGILSITCLWLFASIPAIILGCVALGKTSEPNPEMSGRGIAKAGISTGCIGTIFGLFPMGIWLAVMIPATIQDEIGDRTATVELAEISVAIQRYAVIEGTYPETLQDLIPLHLADDESITMRSSPSRGESPYLYRLEGFRSETPETSPVVLTPELVDGQRIVIFADGKVAATIDETIIELFGAVSGGI